MSKTVKPCNVFISTILRPDSHAASGSAVSGETSWSASSSPNSWLEIKHLNHNQQTELWVVFFYTWDICVKIASLWKVNLFMGQIMKIHSKTRLKKWVQTSSSSCKWFLLVKMRVLLKKILRPDDAVNWFWWCVSDGASWEGLLGRLWYALIALSHSLVQS